MRKISIYVNALNSRLILQMFEAKSFLLISPINQAILSTFNIYTFDFYTLRSVRVMQHKHNVEVNQIDCTTWCVPHSFSYGLPIVTFKVQASFKAHFFQIRLYFGRDKTQSSETSWQEPKEAFCFDQEK